MPVFDIPRCKWCGTEDMVHKCPECLQLTCYDCTATVREGVCYHEKRTPATGHDWTPSTDKAKQ